MVNKDDVIRMAREADPDFGNSFGDMSESIVGIPAIELFAHLIASHVAEECAKVCDEQATCEGIAQKCAQTIRSLYKPTA